MALHVVEDKCRVEQGKMVICMEGATVDEVLSNECRTLAVQKAAAFGLQRVGINGTSGPYPCDAEGKTDDDWNEQSRQNRIVAYRNDITLMGSI